MPSTESIIAPLSLRLPATSANLGPGFDALGLALDLWLALDAEVSSDFAMTATGRDAEIVGALESNLLLETYRDLAPAGPALRLTVRNEIPLGMGCGSSAAALLAGVVLANHFGGLRLSPEEVLAEACRREGHPDNVAACFHGGMTASAMTDGQVVAASFGHQLDWRFILALPAAGLATTVARSLLPPLYTRADAVLNVQATALLVSAFALDRPELLAAGTRDRLHQPYRAAACPLTGRLAPLAEGEQPLVHAVTLSGAGPSALLWVRRGVPVEEVTAAIKAQLMSDGEGNAAEFVPTRIASGLSMRILTAQ